MARGVRGVSDAQSLIDMADVIVVGPGLGKDAWGQGLLQAALDSGKPLVIDADGLNLLALYWPDLQRDDCQCNIDSKIPPKSIPGDANACCSGAGA